jgi:hypothetical protein
MLWVEDRAAVKWGLVELELEQLELVVSFKRLRTSSLATTTSRLCTHPTNT